MDFELFMGCLGNGTIVCNKAVEEYGDYQKIAHISDEGRISWYVAPDQIPGDALLRIEHTANVAQEKYRNWFLSLPRTEQYSRLLDRASHEAFMEVVGMKDDIDAKIAFLQRKENETWQNRASA